MENIFRPNFFSAFINKINNLLVLIIIFISIIFLYFQNYSEQLTYIFKNLIGIISIIIKGNNIFLLSFFVIIIFLTILFIIINFIGGIINTEYLIDDNKISKKINFFNDLRIDIPIEQITNIEYKISWFWDKLLGTGSIYVYTSGSSGVDLKITGIKSVINIYENLKLKIENHKNQIKNIKKTNEHNLDEKINKDFKNSSLEEVVKPDILSVIIINFLSSIFILILIFVNGSNINSPLLIGDKSLVLNIIILFIIINMIFTIIANKRKYYNFYKDKLEYYDGFLTFKKSTIPYERITNISLDQGIIERILGVSIIKINTAGSLSAEIRIHYVKRGDEIVFKLNRILKENGRN